VTRRETVTEMLRRYRDAQEVLSCTEAGSSGAPPLMPRTWDRSFRELERCLGVMRDERRKQYQHVQERYLRSVRRQRVLRFAAGRYVPLGPHEAVVVGFAGPFDPLWDVGQRQRRAGVPEGDCIVEVWQGWVRRETVRDGVEWLAGVFRGEPMLPVEMFEAAA
jgi:hypothetical protein